MMEEGRRGGTFKYEKKKMIIIKLVFSFYFFFFLLWGGGGGCVYCLIRLLCVLPLCLDELLGK